MTKAHLLRCGDSLGLAKPDPRFKSGEILLSPETPSKGIGSGLARSIPPPGVRGTTAGLPRYEDRLSRAFAGALHLGPFSTAWEMGFVNKLLDAKGESRWGRLEPLEKAG